MTGRSQRRLLLFATPLLVSVCYWILCGWFGDSSAGQTLVPGTTAFRLHPEGVGWIFAGQPVSDVSAYVPPRRSDYLFIVVARGADIRSGTFIPLRWVILSAPGLTRVSAMILLAACVAIGRRALIQQGDAVLCLNCGYDLRATPDRCPECGTEVPRASIASNP